MNQVDFVLVWDSSLEKSCTNSAFSRRFTFESGLRKEGLVLKEENTSSLCPQLHFLSIHVPKDVLRCYSEILKLRLPMKQFSEFNMSKGGSIEFNDNESSTTGSQKVAAVRDSFLQRFKQKYLKLNPALIPSGSSNYIYHSASSKSRLTAIYSRDHEYLFALDEMSEYSFFTPNIRSRIVDFILKRTHFSEYDPQGADADRCDFNFGIDKLIKESVYTAAYPLHDGDLSSLSSIRSLLFNQWASLSKLFKYQPLDIIKDYLGVKIGLYYAWLGFYTTMLIPIAILGLSCFFYGLITLPSNSYVSDICNSSTILEPMCPLCNKHCDYWNLHETCFYAKLTYLFDNESTILFAILISLWTVIFLECWKRYLATLCHAWDLASPTSTSSSDLVEEHPRQEYLLRLKNVKKRKVNQITSYSEPVLSFWSRKLPNLIVSLSVSWLLISLAIVAIIGIILYRLSLKVVVLSQWNNSNSYGLLFVTSSAVTINLIFIILFNHLYSMLAIYLTELELHRTQSEFDDSLSLKIYLLQFVNFYSSLFYIAFFKGKFSGTPHHYHKFLGYRNEECSPGGCMSELCIQLAIIMIGKQILNAFAEMSLPIVKTCFRNYSYKCKSYFSKTKTEVDASGRLSISCPIQPSTLAAISGAAAGEDSLKRQPQWIQDYELLEWNSRSLFPEYLEMVLQFGFITIFIAAFPLGPLFALINNVFEMRLDGKKMLKYFRRPVSQRINADIGIWTTILNTVAKLAVISNAFIISFTSNFIPKLVYRLEYGNLNGYLQYSLAYFNTSGFDKEVKPQNPASQFKNVSICRFESFGHVSNTEILMGVEDSNGNRQHSDLYWKIWLARFLFIVVFQNFVFSCLTLIEWIIPDIPKKLNDQIRQEEYTTNEIIIAQEVAKNKKVQLKKSTSNLSTSAPGTSRLKLDELLTTSRTPKKGELLEMKEINDDEAEEKVHGQVQTELRGHDDIQDNEKQKSNESLSNDSEIDNEINTRL